MARNNGDTPTLSLRDIGARHGSYVVTVEGTVSGSRLWKVRDVDQKAGTALLALVETEEGGRLAVPRERVWIKDLSMDDKRFRGRADWVRPEGIGVLGEGLKRRR